MDAKGMQCLTCRAALPDAAKFCIKCGAPAPIPCTGCAHLNHPMASFCAQCGVRLAGTYTTTSALRGVFKDDAKVRAEFLSLAHN